MNKCRLMLDGLLNEIIIIPWINKACFLQELKALISYSSTCPWHPPWGCRLTADLWMIEQNFEPGLPQWPDVCLAHELTLNSGD